MVTRMRTMTVPALVGEVSATARRIFGRLHELRQAVERLYDGCAHGRGRADGG